MYYLNKYIYILNYLRKKKNFRNFDVFVLGNNLEDL